MLCAVLACALAAAPAAARELLENGGFEDGTWGWNGPGISAAGCEPYAGDTALLVPSFAQQNLADAIGPGVHTLSGRVKAHGATASARLHLIWLDASGLELTATSKLVAATSEYGAFSLSASSPAGARGLRLRITAQDGALCLDALSLDGPLAPAATATPAATPTLPPTSVAASRPAPSPAPTSTPAPAFTSEAATAPTPGWDLLNGGFEDGLSGWSKFGGSLSVVDAPVHGGSHAGRLTSTTTATKWAYQTVLVDASRTYEFSGFVSAGDGIRQAYLRISWYATADGSSTATSDSDSVSTIDAAGTYAALSTGPVTPPAGTRSARLRIVLAPAGAAPAAITFDDLSFAPVTAPATPTPEADPPDVQSAEASARSGSATAVSNQGGAAPAQAQPSPGAATQMAAPSLVVATPATVLPAGPLRLNQAGGGVPAVWLAAVAAGSLAMGGFYLLGRRRR
jgi:hypothetical protein